MCNPSEKLVGFVGLLHYGILNLFSQTKKQKWDTKGREGNKKTSVT